MIENCVKNDSKNIIYTGDITQIEADVDSFFFFNYTIRSTAMCWVADAYKNHIFCMRALCSGKKRFSLIYGVSEWSGFVTEN